MKIQITRTTEVDGEPLEPLTEVTEIMRQCENSIEFNNEQRSIIDTMENAPVLMESCNIIEKNDYNDNDSYSMKLLDEEESRLIDIMRCTPKDRYEGKYSISKRDDEHGWEITLKYHDYVDDEDVCFRSILKWKNR